MIRYALVCEQEHTFESWFRDSAAYDSLEQAGAVTCPVCGSATVRKSLMAPSVVTSRRKGKPSADPAHPAEAATPPAAAPSPAPAVLLDSREKRLREMVRALHREIVAKADNVGRDFAAEARRIHDGETEPRSIYGEASKGEVEALLEDGVPLMPMPVLPDDKN